MGQVLAEALGAGAAWTAVLVTVLIYLHTRRQKRMTALEAKIDTILTDSRREHESQAAQIRDISLTMANNYARQPQIESIRREITEAIAEFRKDIGTLHKRIDDLFRTVQWRDPS